MSKLRFRRPCLRRQAHIMKMGVRSLSFAIHTHRGEIRMDTVELAMERMRSGFNCAQSTFSPYAEALGVDRESALKIASGFGGGIGRMAGTCGVVSGALMALGLKYGAAEAADKETKDRMYALAREFAAKFTERQGSIVCKDLLGCDISTPEGHAQAAEQNLFATRCVDLVKAAAELLEEML